jgi:hypothetical protein
VFEEEWYDKLVYFIIRNTQIKTIINDEMKLCYSEPREPRQNFDDMNAMKKQSVITLT